MKSKLLKGLVTKSSEGGRFPDIEDQLKFFQTSFDREKAKKAGVIVPSPGVDRAYDASISQIKATENELQEYLTKQRKRLGSKVGGTGSIKLDLKLCDYRTLSTGAVAATGTSLKCQRPSLPDTLQTTMN